MKLCIVSSGDFFSDYGGGQVYIRTIVDAFIEYYKPEEITLTVISCHSAFSRIPNQKKYNGIDIYEINPDGDIKGLLSSLSPDLVHINGEKLLFAKACKTNGIPCVVTAHHGGIVCPAGALLNHEDKICEIEASYQHCLKCYLNNIPTGTLWYPILKTIDEDRFSKLGEKLDRFPFIPFVSPILKTGNIVKNKINIWKDLSSAASTFIAPSVAMAEALKRNGCPNEKIKVVPHGVPVKQFKPTAHDSHLINFYYVGRICHIKGVHVLLNAFHQIINDRIQLHIIGDATSKRDRRYLNNLQKQYKCDHRIIWHGKQSYENARQLIAKFDVLVHPAICLEVFGLDIAEAISEGKFVIATKCGGTEMQIHNNDEGLLVDPNSVDSLQKAIIQYINHPLTTKAKCLSIKEHINLLIEIYDSTIFAYPKNSGSIS